MPAEMSTRQEVTGTVLFKVRVSTIPVDGGWLCLGKETGIVSFAEDPEAAVERNARMHTLVVKRLKRNGPVALLRFMQARGITDFEVVGESDQAQLVIRSLSSSTKELQAAA